VRRRDPASQPVRSQQVPQGVVLRDTDRVGSATGGKKGEREPQVAAESERGNAEPEDDDRRQDPHPGSCQWVPACHDRGAGNGAGALSRPPKTSDAKIGMSVALAPKKLARKSSDIVPSSTGDSRKSYRPTIAAATG
jgi:hypothetical protein